MALESIVNELFLPFTPEQVWRALTEEEALGRWLMPNDFAPRVGHRFTFRTEPVPPYFDGVVNCVVLTVDPPTRLAYSWSGGPLNDTRLTFTLTPEGDGTRLRLEHAGFDTTIPAARFALANMSKGWRSAEMAERLHGAIAALAVS